MKSESSINFTGIPELKIPRKITFPYAGPSNGAEQSTLPLYGFEPALANPAPVTPKRSKLYLVPTPVRFENEELEPRLQPNPSHLADLPDLEQWVSRYVVSLVEVWSGRRAAMQLARWTHRSVFEGLMKSVGSKRALPKIRNIYISQPIDGVGEVTVTLRYDERIRSLVMRFEGVDRRWLCTELFLI